MTIEELQAINYHWRLAIDQIQEGIMIVQGPKGDLERLRIVFANRAAMEYLGLPSGEIKEQRISNLVDPADRARLEHEWAKSTARFRGKFLLKTSAGPLEAEWLVTSRPGSSRREPDHTVSLTWPSKSGAAQNNGFELSKADTISSIAKGIVHDFNNSLATIRGHLEVAYSEVEQMPTPRQALQSAVDAVDTVSELCRRLLNYAKGQKAEKRSCDVAEIVKQAVAITGIGANVTCRRLIQPNLWPIMADGIQIVQVINNLLLNAQQAMPNGGVIVVVAENIPIGERSTIGLPPGNYVAITIRDRGAGIPDEYREQIFESLFTTKAQGSGLGLATCARIVSAHDGYIDVHSVPNRGSEFIVYLPATEAVPSSVEKTEPQETTWPIERAKPAPKSKPSLRSVSEHRILIVDDEEGIGQVAKLYLEKYGHSVECALSGQDALRVFREARNCGDPFDLAIIDMTLPGGMSGQDTLRELRLIDPQLVAVATSGCFNEDDLPLLCHQGFAASLAKPFPLKQLGEVVEEAMRFHHV